MAGEFLYRYFSDTQELNVKSNHEADVLCPFPHDKGMETRPSAHINTENGVFHCKTCSAEGRFSNGGLSEAAFISKIYGISYSEAVSVQGLFNKNKETDETWDEAVNILLGNEKYVTYLNNRGITTDLIKDYKLGYMGEGIVYPVFVHGVILDKRTYNIAPEKNEAKIKSQYEASPLLFPFDHWRKDDRPTLLTAGENDTLLARKHGFNAVTSTFGEGSFPKNFRGLFKNKQVYICFDCDEAGRKGRLHAAFVLKEAGANVYLVDLGLTGEKDDKDLTDFFIKHGKTADDFQQRLDEAVQYDGEMYQRAKNEYYPLVDLWNVPHGEYSGKKLSSRVSVMGKISTAHGTSMETPTAIEWECRNPVEDNPACITCKKMYGDGWWTLDDHNLEQLLELVEVDKVQQERAINRFIGLPPKCPGVTKVRREKKHVQKVILAPDAETEGIADDENNDFKMVEHYSYVLGLDLEDGQRYRAYHRRYPHPKTQAVVSVVDKVEPSDIGINQFKIDDEMIRQLSTLQGHPDKVMEERFTLAKEIVGNFAPRAVVESVNIVYHSVLDFRLAGKPIDKGYPEGLIIGASRTGKSKTAERLMRFLKLGNMTNMKNASVAGLLGGADKLPSGGHKITWGKIPRNHRGMLIMDEMSGMPKHVLSAMTDMRSNGVATIEKIVSGKVPAKTRLLWISNQRPQADDSSRPIMLYSNGVDIVRELVGTNEDIARFDFIAIIPETAERANPFDVEKVPDHLDNTPYRNLIYWAWTRNLDQIKFASNVERYIWQKSEELNDKYYTEGLNLFGNEAFTKLARIAVSCAAMCFSHDGTGESVLVLKEHVDWSVDFMVRCYDNNVFRIRSFVENERKFSTTNEEVNTLVFGILKKYPMLVKLLLDQDCCPIYNLKAAGGIGDEEFKHITNQMYTNGLINIKREGYTATRRLRLAIDASQSRTVKKQVDMDKPKSFFDKINLN